MTGLREGNSPYDLVEGAGGFQISSSLPAYFIWLCGICRGCTDASFARARLIRDFGSSCKCFIKIRARVVKKEVRFSAWQFLVHMQLSFVVLSMGVKESR
ncbi:hypothetical protein GQ457_06G031700 [Hibiscus cannabinus]